MRVRHVSRFLPKIFLEEGSLRNSNYVLLSISTMVLDFLSNLCCTKLEIIPNAHFFGLLDASTYPSLRWMLFSEIRYFSQSLTSKIFFFLSLNFI